MQPVPISPLQRVNSAEGNGFNCLEFLQPAGYQIPKHAHSTPMLLFVLAGSASEHLRTRKYEQFASTVVFRPAEEEHSHSYGNCGVRCLAVELSSEIRLSAADISPRLNDYTQARDPLLFSLGLHLRREMQRTDTARSAAMEELLFAALLKLLKAERPVGIAAPLWLRRAQEMIHDCFLERLKLSEIARSAGVHPIYLADSYRKFFGSSIGKTVRQLRLNHAIDQLTRTAKPITDVALETGFFDHAHFTNFVKLKMGLTPSELRKLTKSAWITV
jgi:AraC family transcriptional regulator